MQVGWIGAGTWREARKIRNGDVIKKMRIKRRMIVKTRMIMMMI